jgi:hypothetical protein
LIIAALSDPLKIGRDGLLMGRFFKDMDLKQRSDIIDLLETYSIWLEKNYYMDSDWRRS